MTLPLVPVFCRILDQTSDPIANAIVELKLNKTEVYNSFIIPETFIARTDENGEATLNVFPNELGTQSSSYKVTISTSEKVIRGTAVIPNAACDLFQVMELKPYPPSTLIERAISESRNASTAKQIAEAAKASAELAAINASNSSLTANTAKTISLSAQTACLSAQSAVEAMYESLSEASGNGFNIIRTGASLNYTAAAFDLFEVDSSTHSVTITLPSSGIVQIVDISRNAKTNPITVTRASSAWKFDGVSDDYQIDIDGGNVTFIADTPTMNYSVQANNTFQTIDTSDFMTKSSDLTTLIPKSVGTAKGSLIGFTTAGTPVNVGIGLDNQVLTAMSSASAGVAWTSNAASVTMDDVIAMIIGLG